MGVRADDVEERAPAVADDGAEGQRHIRRAEGGGADLGDGLGQALGDECQGVDVRGLALVGAHAGRGVALDVLDRAEAFAQRQAEILRRDVVLEVDEGLLAGARAVGRHGPERAERHWSRGEAGEIASAGADGSQGNAGCGVRHEGLQPVVEAELAAGLAEERDIGVPAAGDQQHDRRARRRPDGRRCRPRRSARRWRPD